MSGEIGAMKSSRCLALLFFWLMTSVHAQAPTTPPRTAGAIFGIVLDRETKLPIRRANVMLSTVETEPQEALAWTDANGRFSFGYLPAGRYHLRVFKDGYEAVVYGAATARRPAATIQLSEGEVRSDFVLRMQLTNSISGVVLDDDGDPLAGVQIIAMAPGFQRRKHTLIPGPMAVTDADGRYRLNGLAPGRYTLVAVHLYQQVLKVRPEVTAGQQSQQGYSYGSQYYPGTDRPESASQLTLQPGQALSQINFRLTAQPAVSVQGKVILPPGAVSTQSVSVNITNQDLSNRMNLGAGANPPDFSFHFGQLPPATYIIAAQATVDGKSYRGVQTVEAGPQGIRDLAIPVEACIDITGAVSVEGPDVGKYSASFVSLASGDGLPFNGPQLRGSVAKDGSFKITGVPPGIWDIDVHPIPPNGYLKSMMLGDRDVLTEDMVIRPSTSGRLKIVVGTQAAVIEGDVSQGDQPAQAIVLLAPEAKFRHVLSFYRFATADDKGHFEIKNARPGKYKLYAFDELDRQSIQDPDFLKPFESAGTLVTLREGQNASQKLSIIPSAHPPPESQPSTAGSAPGEIR